MKRNTFAIIVKPPFEPPLKFIFSRPCRSGLNTPSSKFAIATLKTKPVHFFSTSSCSHQKLYFEKHKESLYQLKLSSYEK